MTPVRGLNPIMPRDLEILANGVKKSIDHSMDNFNSTCSETSLKMRPSFLTDKVIESARNLIKDPKNRDPMLIIEIEAGKVEIAFVTMHGENVNQVLVADKWELKNIFKYLNSAESFLGHIASECYKMVDQFSHCFGRIAAQNVLCSIILNFLMDQTSLRDSTVTKFSKGFFVGNCEGRDMVKILNAQLDKCQNKHSFKIICMNMQHGTVATTAGFCIQETTESPDLVQFSSRGNNICFFDLGHDIAGLQGQRMVINAHIHRFGLTLGSEEFNLLTRFLEKHDFEICDINKGPYELFNLLMGAFKMCDSVQQFLRKKMPDFAEKFPSMNVKDGISEEDISDLLIFVEKEIRPKSGLVKVYEELGEEYKKELYEFCIKLRDRAARMLAGISFGVLKRIVTMTGKNRIIVGLEGKVMLGMYGFKAEFLKSHKSLCAWDAKKNKGSVGFDVVFKEANDACAYFGVLGVAKYIWNVHEENPANYDGKIYEREIF